MNNLAYFDNLNLNSGFRNLFPALVLLIGLNGCASEPVVPPDYYAEKLSSHVPDIKRVAIVTDLTPPKIESVNQWPARDDVASDKAAEGAFTGAASVPPVLLAAPPIYFAVLPFFVAGGAVGGAIEGYVSGYSEDELAEMRALVERIIDCAFYQNMLLEKVAEYGKANVAIEFIRIPSADQEALLDKPDYSTLLNESFDAVLEVELPLLALKKSTQSKDIRLELVSRIRLVSTHSNDVLSDNLYRYHSSTYEPDIWFSNEAELLATEIQRGLQKLAESAVDENFLLFFPKVYKEVPSKWDVTNKGAPYYVLAPIYTDKEQPYYWVKDVASLQPTLRWERFPRDYDLYDDSGQRYNITNVRYDLRVFKRAHIPRIFGSTYNPIHQIYDLHDIPQPYYKFEEDLEPCSAYLWTVRARFELDGRDRLTEWAGAYATGGAANTPWRNRRAGTSFIGGSYAIQTPCAQEMPEEPDNSVSAEDEI